MICAIIAYIALGYYGHWNVLLPILFVEGVVVIAHVIHDVTDGID